MTKIQTKTKTAVGVALAIASIGTAGFVAGLYYYGQRIDFSGSKANCNCPVCPTCPKCDTAGKETPPETPTPAGQPDLALVAVIGPASSYEVGQPIKFTMTVKNQGIAPSGAFNVKIYQSAGHPIGTWSISNLDAGDSVSNAITVAPDVFCSIHSWCSFSVRVDPDNQVTESNEKNNSWSRTSFRAR